MVEVLRGDSATRKRAVLLIILGAFTGTVLIIGFEHYRTPLRNWLLSEPGELAHRVKLLFLLSSALLSAPLLAFAVYLWLIGAN